MEQNTKFENEQQRAMKEAEISKHMKEEYLARKQLLITELKEINAQLDKL